MSKINLLAAILVFSLLSACGFHAPTDTTSLNASITGNTEGAFATALKKHFNAKATQSLTLRIGNEVQKQRTSAYSAGTASSHVLILGVPVKISRDKKTLLSKTLTASTIVSELPTAQANRLQIAAAYVQLRDEIITKLLRRLKVLK